MQSRIDEINRCLARWPLIEGVAGGIEFRRDRTNGELVEFTCDLDPDRGTVRMESGECYGRPYYELTSDAPTGSSTVEVQPGRSRTCIETASGGESASYYWTFTQKTENCPAVAHGVASEILGKIKASADAYVVG